MDDSETSGAESALEHGFQLGEFMVEPRAGIVSGPAGRVQVDPKVMAVLVLLAQRAGEVVPREQLLARVWTGTVVSDDALSRCIYQLRRHLCEAGGSDRFKALFETFPKRGYRLNCEVAAPLPEPVVVEESRTLVRQPARTMRARVVVTVSTLVVGSAVSITAVWITTTAPPDVRRTTNTLAYNAYVRANDYFGRSDRLTALPYAVELYEQAVDLDPTFILALIGLAKAHTDMYWHGIDTTPSRLEHAEKALDRLFDLAPDLPAAQLARANYFFKGLNRYEAALTELEEAEESISDDAELFFLRAMVHRRLASWDLAIEALDDALQLESRNILYLRQQYINYQFIRDYDGADELLNRITALYPDDGTAYVDRVVLSLCRDGSTALARQYAASAPSEFYDDGLAYTYTSWLAAIYDRDYERALRILDDSVEDPVFDGDLRNSSFGPKVLFYARSHQLSGDYARAQEAYRTVVGIIEEQLSSALTEDFRKTAGRYLALAEAHAALGHRQFAWDSLQQAKRLVPAYRDALSSSAFKLASVVRVLIPAGYDEEALRELDDYFGNEAGHWSIEGVRNDPRVERILNHTEFRALEEKYGRLSGAA